MSFKVGDFYICTNAPMTINYVKSQANIHGEYEVISVIDGTEFHMKVCNNCILHPTLGIKPNDEVLYNQNTFTNIRLESRSSHLLLTEKTAYIVGAYTPDFILENFTHKSNPHWNTCAHHYRTHVLNQTCPVIQTSLNAAKISPIFKRNDVLISNYGGHAFVMNVDLGHAEYELTYYPVTNHSTSWISPFNTCEKHYTLVSSNNTTQSQGILMSSPPKFSVGDKILDTRAGQFVINGTVSKVDTTRNEYTIAWLGGASTVQDFTSAEKDFVLDLPTGQNTNTAGSWNSPYTGTYNVYRGSTTPQLDKAIETIQKEFGSNCNHKFIEYDSGWTKYTFCEKCNYKKD